MGGCHGAGMLGARHGRRRVGDRVLGGVRHARLSANELSQHRTRRRGDLLPCQRPPGRGLRRLSGAMQVRRTVRWPPLRAQHRQGPPTLPRTRAGIPLPRGSGLLVQLLRFGVWRLLQVPRHRSRELRRLRSTVPERVRVLPGAVPLPHGGMLVRRAHPMRGPLLRPRHVTAPLRRLRAPLSVGAMPRRRLPGDVLRGAAHTLRRGVSRPPICALRLRLMRTSVPIQRAVRRGRVPVRQRPGPLRRDLPRPRDRSHPLRRLRERLRGGLR